MASRKVALFNDTTAEGHFGCDAVMATLRREIESRGGEIIYRHPVGRDWRSRIRARRALAAADVVIVNGEGSIHHTRSRARSLAALAPHCAELGKPAFLVNATVQGNSSALMSQLLRFRKIWVRDSASRAEVRKAGGEASIVGDLSFGQALTAAQGGKGIVVVDSVSRQGRVRLAGLADLLQSEFLSMHHSPGPAFRKFGWYSKRYSTRWRSNRVRLGDFGAYARHIGEYDHVVTGRYHALCFAISIRLPVSVIPSNTGKNEALIADIGLSSSRSFSVLPEIAPYSREELQSIDSFLARTRSERGRMFDEILQA